MVPATVAAMVAGAVAACTHPISDRIHTIVVGFNSVFLRVLVLQ